MTRELVQTSCVMFRQTAPPPALRVKIALLFVFVDLAVDFASTRRPLVRVLLGQGGFELMVGICRTASANGTLDSNDGTYLRGRDLPSTSFP
jgi:hypothetical protein